jgi:hypothetical protein
VNVKGSIEMHCDCSWSFSGNFSSAKGYDPYDFDASNRGLKGELLTWVGGHRCPKKGAPFNIYLPGSIQVSTGGKVNGQPTCGC